MWHRRDEGRGEENVCQCDLEKEDPAEAHQLIVAKPGQGPAHPDKEKEQAGDLGEEDRDVEETTDDSAPAA